MQIQVNGSTTYCYTGGKPFDAAKPTVVFIHGVLNDHSVWALQSRYMAHHGWNVLAVDLPGHCRSAGEAPASVEAGADFIAALLDAAGLQRAALVGHSFGSLIALEAAARLGTRVSHLVLVGTAYPMKVSPALIDAALNEPEKALRMVNVFSRSTLAPPSGAGFWVYNAGMALGRKVLRSNTAVNVFHRGFVACDSYANGEQAIAAVQCPVLFALGAQDQMTAPKAAQGLVAAARAAGKAVQTTSLPVGHNQMSEAPDETLMAIRDFLVK
ncbi:alpha/beta hydrolase [Acidovorax sp. Leaf76]|uniref:alpha/beta fold hydrolase n=1 Tax=unclassified Acidovorax TaxID=2684926 RepID=UPI000701C0DF|nr:MULTISPECIES: alpha/beta hydrolase [unclassified Acidovorax]KQO24412.1 alpha/beta hydrolase [Acidovorax sp. Leaf76]KQO39439.1 alpha/beta hydrolase [Acidovorax sp. Leaf84]KQS24605.1 alpha/beta hydrolase [Acidovorax sp. Leaf191]